MTEQSLPEESIFLQAVQIESVTARSGYLDRACKEDASLRAKVEALLHAHEKSGDLLDVPDSPRVVVDRSPAETPGTVIGRYKLFELIGEGGFGAVYLAEQAEPVRRKVALKIIKLGMDTRQVIARFEAERQALALMEHPNIAKVLDAGATETGRPYFVMELVRGVPITDYCDEHRLATRDRLRLFIDVCRAVQHAHQKGIIHRDIKPSNVMVTLVDGKPVPKVIDFGIAKATQQRLTEKTLYTEHHQLIGTPQYMSPEQAALCDEDVDTRSDVYSLGVLLYELLVGTTPFAPEELREASYNEICRTIRETDPPTPSRRLSTMGTATAPISERRQVQSSALRKLLRGDLDRIVMKALEKDRTRRYETANGLALDIERYLSDEPVLARAPSTAYRLKKFIRKHRWPVAAAAAVLAALILGLVLALAGFARARHERQTAVAAEGRAKTYARQLEVQSTDLARQLYVSDVRAAYHEWDEGNISQVRELLGRHIPQPGAEDLRGFEWRYLWKQYQRAASGTVFTHEQFTSMAFSPDGSVLASGGNDGTVKFWQVGTGQPLPALAYKVGFNSVAFSPDGKTLATGTLGHTVRLWDLATRTLLGTLQHGERVAALAFSPNCEILASAGGHYEGGDIKLWRAADHTELATLSGHTARVGAVVFSPDGKTLVSGSWDRTVKLWDVEARRELATLSGHTDRVSAVALCPDGKTLASAGHDGTVKLWDVAARTVRTELVEPLGKVWALAFSPNGKTLALGCDNSRVWLWKVANKEPYSFISGHSLPVTCVAFSPDGTVLATGSDDDTIRLTEVRRFDRRESVPSHTDWLTYIAVAPSDGKTMAAASGEMTTESMSGQIVLWDMSTRQRRMLKGAGQSPAYGAALSPDGQVLATGGGRGAGVVRLWDVPTGKLLGSLPGHEAAVFAVAFSPDGTTLASGDWGHPGGETPKSGDWGAEIKLWDVATAELRETFRADRFAATSLAFSPDGKTLAIGGGTWYDGEIKLWDLPIGAEPRRFAAIKELIWSLAFSGDGRTLASADAGGSVALWDIARGARTLTLDAHTGLAFSVAFSPDGKTLASAGWDKTVRLWQVATGDELAALVPHAAVSSVAFFPDGDTLAGGCMDKTVTLWSVGSGEEVLEYVKDEKRSQE